MKNLMEITRGIGGMEAICACGERILIRLEGSPQFRLELTGQLLIRCPKGHSLQTDAETFNQCMIVPVRIRKEDDDD